MKILAMIALAYVLAGIHYVWRDLREPEWNRPSYTYGGVGSLLFTVLYWLPGTITSTYIRGPIKRHVVSWIVFAGLLFGMYVAS